MGNTHPISECSGKKFTLNFKPSHSVWSPPPNPRFFSVILIMIRNCHREIGFKCPGYAWEVMVMLMSYIKTQKSVSSGLISRYQEVGWKNEAQTSSFSKVTLRCWMKHSFEFFKWLLKPFIILNSKQKVHEILC